MAYIETDNSNYYFHKIGSLIFGTLFFLGGFIPLVTGGTITINDVPTKASIVNTSPFLLVGGGSIILFIWMCSNYFKVTLTDYHVKKQIGNKGKTYNWEDIEEIDEVTWLWKGTIYKIKPKNERRFYTLADRGRVAFNNPFKSGLDNLSHFKTKMGEFLSRKKAQLKI